MLLKNKEKINIDSGIMELQLSKNDLQYLLNEKEFYPHVYVDMVKDFKKFYYIYYKDIIDFDNYVIYYLKILKKYKEKNYVFKFWF